MAKKDKEKIYACGEDIRPEKLNVPCDSFCRVLIKAFGLQQIRRLHSGDVGAYLLWIFAGMVVLIVLLVALW